MNEVQWFYSNRGTRVGPISDCDIRGLIGDQTIGYGTQVWRKGMADWIAVEASELKEELSTSPPPLNKDRVSDLWVWLLALTPIAWMAIDTSYLHSGVLLGWVACLAFALLDVGQLRKAGYLRPSMWWSFVTPGYLYVRSRVLSNNQAPLIVWVLLNIVIAIVPR